MRQAFAAFLVVTAGFALAPVVYAQPSGDANVARTLYREAQNYRANGKVHLALFEAGVTESGMRNLNYGDRDSIGVLQLRVSLWGYAQASSPSLSARWFLREAIRIQSRYYSAGALAQAVERSAFPDRYRQNVRWAEAWLRFCGYGGWLP